MQPTSFTRSALEASTQAASSAQENQAVIAAHPIGAEQSDADAARQTDGSTIDFALELAQVADGEQPVLQLDTKAPAEQPASETDAEQWLLHMLEQQSAHLQARDANHGSNRETHEAVNAAIQALPRAVAAAELAEQVASDRALKAPQETLKAPGETFKAPAAEPKESAELLKASGETREASVGALKAPAVALNAPAEELISGTVTEARGAQPEKLKLDPALFHRESAPLNAQPERVAAGASVTTSEVATRLDATLMNTPVTESTALERTLKLQGPETKWGEQLLLALRDNVNLQMQQRVQNTTIRLDPPELGMMEITLIHEQGRLNVQISAQHSDVVRLLQQTSERLRHELVAQNFTQVDVEISGGQPGQQHSQRDQARLLNEPSVLANNHEADQSDAQHLAPEQQKSAKHNDVLVTV